MKNYFRISLVFAFSLFLLVSCSKDQNISEKSQDQDLVTITFSAEKAGLNTKTAAVEGDNSVSYIWTTEDISNIKLFTVETIDNDGQQVEILTEIANNNLTITKESDRRLTIAAEVTPNATYTFRAILCDPSSYTGSGSYNTTQDKDGNYNTRKPKTKAQQNPNGIDNFDPTADILVSDDKQVIVPETTEGETINTGTFDLIFRRKVVVNKMTLKNLGAGEKVKKVEITSTTGDIQGYLNNGQMSGQSKVITLNYSDFVVPEGGQFPVYFISMPNTGIALKVDVTTDQNLYTKSFAEGKSIDLNLGQFTKFNVALPAGTPATQVANGQYFITGIYNGSVYAATAYTSGNNLSNPIIISVDKDNEQITSTTNIQNCLFTFTCITDGEYAGKYTIQDVNGLYLYAAGGNGSSPKNQLKGEANPDTNGNAYWTVSKNADGTYSIESAGNASRRILRFNPTNENGPIFSCYGSGQNPVTIYPASWYEASPVTETTISNILADNTITSDNTVNYEVDGVTVMAKQNKNYIIADATGVMLMYYTGTLTVGSQYRVSGSVKLYSGVHEFSSPTVTTSTGTAPEYGTPEEMTVTSLTAYESTPVTKYAVVSLTAPESGFVGSDGTNSINVFDGTGTWANFYGKDVIVTGYLIGYYNSMINFLATNIEEDPSIPSISVSPSSLSWSATEFGSSNAKTLTVTLNGSAAAGDYTVNGSSSDWTISNNNSGTITVYPNAANTSTSDAKTLTLTITHKDDSSVSKQVTLTQAKASSGGLKTYSMTPDKESTGSNASSYITEMTNFTYNGISWNMNQWNPSSLQIKTNQSSATAEFRFYNTSAFSGRITKVVITFSAMTVSDASKLMFLGGSSAVTATTGGTAGTWNSTSKTLTWTPAASDNFTFFAFYQNGKAASGTNKLATADAIVVTYE